jgi:pimeloyl-ACP methyl ester carboxylesterase
MKLPARPLLVDTLSDLGRSGFETARLALRLRGLVAEAPRGDGHLVLTLPGYGGGDASMSLLRLFLRRIGYAPVALGLGVNVESAERTIRSVDDALAFRARMVERVVERIREIHRTTGERVSLVGWSLGGLYAYDAAREAPECVRGVITLGAPYGDPRGTSLFSLLRWLSGSDVPIETQDFAGWIARSAPGPGAIPIRVLYSPRDGIVSPEIARPPDHPSIECIAVDSSHIGFCTNLEALREIARQLPLLPSLS